MEVAPQLLSYLMESRIVKFRDLPDGSPFTHDGTVGYVKVNHGAGIVPYYCNCRTARGNYGYFGPDTEVEPVLPPEKKRLDLLRPGSAYMFGGQKFMLLPQGVTFGANLVNAVSMDTGCVYCHNNETLVTPCPSA